MWNSLKCETATIRSKCWPLLKSTTDKIALMGSVKKRVTFQNVSFSRRKLNLIFQFILQGVSGILASLICKWWFDFKPELIFGTCPAASKTKLASYVVKTVSKMIPLLPKILICETQCKGVYLSIAKSLFSSKLSHRSLAHK